MVVWKIHLDEEGRTTPVLDLLTKVPEQGNVIHSRASFWAFNYSACPAFLAALGKMEIHLAEPNQGNKSQFSKQLSITSCITEKGLQNFSTAGNLFYPEVQCWQLQSGTVQLFKNTVHCYVFLAVLEQNRATIENAPARFRSMLLLFGIETAIENLIKALDSEKWIPALLTTGSNFKSSFN